VQHKLDLEAALQRVRDSNAATDLLLLERFQNFSLKMCQDDAAAGKVRSGGEATYYRSLCDPCNPCSSKELAWFSHMMTYPARSSSEAVKEKENMDGLRECMKCKTTPEFDQYLKGLVDYAAEQTELRDARTLKAKEQQPKKKKKKKAKEATEQPKKEEQP